MKDTLSISKWLIRALQDAGVQHVFGIPGDYALGLFRDLEASSLKLVNTCDEQGAGFAADAYARVRGLGVAAITYGVGGLKLVNSTAQAYAERSPVIVVSGAPGVGEMHGDALLHHKVRDFGTQMRVFREVTAAQCVLDDPTTAPREIARVLAVAKDSQRPVYVEFPRDCVDLPVPPHAATGLEPRPQAEIDSAALNEAVDEAVAMVNAADNPCLLLGVEVHRFGLQDEVVKLIAKSRIRFATTIMGKSVINEELPGFVGVYAGSLSNEMTRSAVEQSDCVISLGAMMTDLNTGIFTADLELSNMVQAQAETLRIRRHHYPGIDLKSFIDAFTDASLRRRPALPASYHAGGAAFTPDGDRSISIERVFECLEARLTEEVAVIADPGDALFGAIDLTIHSRTEFIACAYYASLGFAVPGAIGLQMAQPNWRPLVLVGDGAFQMTGVELTTAARYGLNPIVMVLDNCGYGTERPMLDGEFNDVHGWNISALTDLIQSGRAFDVEDEAAFEQALETALSDRDHIALIHVRLAPDDFSPALKRLTGNLKQRV